MSSKVVEISGPAKGCDNCGFHTNVGYVCEDCGVVFAWCLSCPLAPVKCHDCSVSAFELKVVSISSHLA